MKTYDVRRQHLGDKMYMPGDQRDALPADVAHLVANGVLSDAEPDVATKAEKPVKNKAAKPLANKAD